MRSETKSLLELIAKAFLIECIVTGLCFLPYAISKEDVDHDTVVRIGVVWLAIQLMLGLALVYFLMTRKKLVATHPPENQTRSPQTFWFRNPMLFGLLILGLSVIGNALWSNYKLEQSMKQVEATRARMEKERDAIIKKSDEEAQEILDKVLKAHPEIKLPSTSIWPATAPH